MAYYQAGVYGVEITGQGLIESKNGTPGFFLGFEPSYKIDERSGDQVPVEKSYPRECKRWITEKSIEHAVEDLTFLGYDRPDFSSIDPRSKNHFSFTGLRVEMTCKINDNGYEEWRLKRNFGGQAEREVVLLDAKKASKLDALIGAALKKAIGSKPKPAATQPVAAPASSANSLVNGHGAAIDDSDVPF